MCGQEVVGVAGGCVDAPLKCEPGSTNVCPPRVWPRNRASLLRMRPVVIVGAGSAGLAVAAELQRREIAAIVLERGPSVATSWRARHEDLRLNTIRWLSDLPGLRMPRSYGRWVSRDDYISYLEHFAEECGLEVRCEVEVHRIDRSGDLWRLNTSDGDVSADHVVVATGYDRVPWVPDWPGRATFEVPLIHVAHHRRAADFAGQRVLLVGAGNSGIEVGGHLVEAGVAELWVSVRTPPSIVPREILGLPLHPLSVASRRLPEPVLDSNIRLISRLAFGNLETYGLPTPELGAYERLRTTGVTVAVDQGFVRHVKAGHVQLVPEVERLERRSVILSDGRRVGPDVVIAATGFRRGLDGLVGHLGVLDVGGLPAAGSARPSSDAPGLWFTGFRAAIDGMLRLHRIEARRIADTIFRLRTPHRGLRPRRTR